MAYSTPTLISSEFKSITFSATTKVTEDEVTQFIVEADAYIDARIGLIYTTPVTLAASPKSMEVLKTISIGLVAQRIAKIMELKSTSPQGDQAIPVDLAIQARANLEMIVKRELLLSDAVSISSVQGVKSYSSSNTVTRVFDQSKTQW